MRLPRGRGPRARLRRGGRRDVRPRGAAGGPRGRGDDPRPAARIGLTGGGIRWEAAAQRQPGGPGEGSALPRAGFSPSSIAMGEGEVSIGKRTRRGNPGVRGRAWPSPGSVAPLLPSPWVGGEGVPASPAARCGRHFRTDTSPCQPSRWERGLGVRAVPGGPAARCGAASQRTPPPVSRIGGKVRGVAELVSAQAVGASRRPRGPRRAGQRRPAPAGRAGRAGRAPPGDRGGPGCRAPASPSPQVAGNATRRARRLPCR